jgi:hypothetical protein
VAVVFFPEPREGPPADRARYPGAVDLSGLGRVLLIVSAVIAVVGLILVLAGKGVIPRLPGDIVIERKNFRFYFPLATSIVASVVLTVLLNLFLRR